MQLSWQCPKKICCREKIDVSVSSLSPTVVKPNLTLVE
jgi:hypothetical protein